MGIRVHVGKLFQHGLKDATPRRMSTFINTRIINPNLNPTLSFCNTLHEEEQAKVTDAPLPTYSLPKQEHVQEEGKGEKHTRRREEHIEHHPPEDPTFTTTGGTSTTTP